MSPAVEMRADDAAPSRSVFLFTPGDLLFWIYLYPGPFLARLIPPRALCWMGQLGEPVLQLLARGRKDRAVRWIVDSGCASPQRAAGIARRSVSQRLFQSLDELILLRRDRERLLNCIAIDGWEHFERAKAEGKGVILLSAHFGANRVGTMHLIAKGYSILSVHNQSPRNRNGGHLGRHLVARSVELRHRANPDVVYIQDPQCSLRILQTLRRGGAVRIQGDGFAGSKWIDCEFLGVPWRLPTGVFEIARVAGCAVVPMITLGRGTGFRILFKPKLPIVQAGSRAEFVSANLPVFLQAIEQQVRDYPDEWILWTHY